MRSVQALAFSPCKRVYTDSSPSPLAPNHRVSLSRRSLDELEGVGLANGDRCLIALGEVLAVMALAHVRVGFRGLEVQRYRNREVVKKRHRRHRCQPSAFLRLLPSFWTRLCRVHEPWNWRKKASSRGRHGKKPTTRRRKNSDLEGCETPKALKLQSLRLKRRVCRASQNP